jgi:hypothetical protein
MTVDLPDNIIEPPGEDEQPGPHDDATETPEDRFLRLQGEARSPELLVWLDLETAGPTDAPNPQADTVLECAWAITYRDVPANLRYRTSRWDRDAIDLTDWQLTPLRSRLCSIGPDEGAWSRTPMIPAAQGRWRTGWPQLADNVIKMHDDSGLTDDHLAAQRDGRIVGEAQTLTRLILDDIIAAVRQVRTEQGFEADVADPAVYIAGDGVGHYDQPLLRRDQFNPLGRAWHYRPEDISHAVHLLAPVRHPVQLLLAGAVAQDYGRLLADGLDVDPRIDLRHGGGREVLASWVTADKVAHRAAADVFRSMMAYLTARHLVSDKLTGNQY